MNLHAIAGPIVAAVNPQIPVSASISTGVSATLDDGTQVPGYATPGSITASIGAGDGVLTVTDVAAGLLAAGQTLSGADVAPGLLIGEQLSGDPGGPGTYRLGDAGHPAVAEEAMTTSLQLVGQVQPLTAGDLRQLDGINLGGVRWKIYLSGQVDAIVRPERKGGDLLTISTGRHQGVWLVVQVMEQWPDWCCAAIVQQNDGS